MGTEQASCVLNRVRAEPFAAIVGHVVKVVN